MAPSQSSSAPCQHVRLLQQRDNSSTQGFSVPWPLCLQWSGDYFWPISVTTLVVIPGNLVILLQSQEVKNPYPTTNCSFSKRCVQSLLVNFFQPSGPPIHWLLHFQSVSPLHYSLSSPSLWTLTSSHLSPSNVPWILHLRTFVHAVPTAGILTHPFLV